MQQAEAARAEIVFVALTQKFRSFLLRIWAILQNTKWHKISTPECVDFYFPYTLEVFWSF